MNNKQDINKIFTQVLNMLTLQDYEDIILSLDGDIVKKTNQKWILRTMCHHKDVKNGKPKLEFYLETKTFYCFSGCQTSYNIVTLVQQRFKVLGEEKNRFQCLQYMVDTCKLDVDLKNFKFKEKSETKCNWQSSLNKYIKHNNTYGDLKIYDKSILNTFEDKYHIDWLNEGISIETMAKYNIKWYAYRNQIVIPIYSDKGDFVGIHARNLDSEVIAQGYKYMPLSTLSGMEYSFPTGQVLYGLNVNKENIKYTKTAIIFEAPKSPLILESMKAINNSVGNFGMSFNAKKRDLLLDCGCEHFIIALDRQYQQQYKDEEYCDEFGNSIKMKTDEYKKYLNIIYKWVQLLQPYGTVEIILDNDEDRLLDYKDAPVDKGKEVWEKLYNNRKEWKDIE